MIEPEIAFADLNDDMDAGRGHGASYVIADVLEQAAPRSWISSTQLCG